jgi:hypothetical protein
MPLTPDELHELVATIDGLGREITGLRVALVTADKRSRWARSVAIVGVVAGIIGGAVGVGGVVVGASAQATADDLAASRKEAQVSGCVQANLQTQRTRDALIAGVSVLTGPNPQRDSDEQARVDRFFLEYSNNIKAALPFRDCSPGGIKSYYEHPPIDPALSVGPITSSTVVTR